MPLRDKTVGARELLPALLLWVKDYCCQRLTISS